MKEARGLSVSELFANTSARTHSNQSELRVWMADNHDEFLAGLKERPRGWGAISLELAKAGFKKPDGSDVDGGYARRTWHRVRASFERTQPKPIAKPADEHQSVVSPGSVALPSEPAMPKPTVTPVVREVTPAVTPVPMRQFRYATPKEK